MLKKVNISSLKLAAYNPVTRTTPNNIKGLRVSIEKVGLLQPILINKKNEVVDGHRRICVMKEMGETSIPAIVVEGDREEMYAEVNSQKKSLNGVQVLEIYLKEPSAITLRTRNQLAEMEETLGRPMLERMLKLGFAKTVYETAKRVCTEGDAPNLVVKTTKWVVRYRCRMLVNRALAAGTPASKILSAVKSGKPLKPTFTVG